MQVYACVCVLTRVRTRAPELWVGFFCMDVCVCVCVCVCVRMFLLQGHALVSACADACLCARTHARSRVQACVAHAFFARAQLLHCVPVYCCEGPCSCVLPALMCVHVQVYTEVRVTLSTCARATFCVCMRLRVHAPMRARAPLAVVECAHVCVAVCVREQGSECVCMRDRMRVQSVHALCARCPCMFVCVRVLCLRNHVQVSVCACAYMRVYTRARACDA
jgi:hypothetical protein